MDNKQQKGSADSSKINVHEDYELRYWSEKFKITPQQLRDAVKAVGVNVKDVEQHLQK